MTREQFIQHVEGTQKALRRFLCALCCGDTLLADDIAQETYLKAYMSFGDIREHTKFSSWIYRIAYNTFISYKRAERQFCRYDEALNMRANSVADRAFRYEDLYLALNSLSEKERTAILLFYLDSYSIKEIAEIVESSSDAVKQQLSRGRAHLKEILHKSDYNFDS